MPVSLKFLKHLKVGRTQKITMVKGMGHRRAGGGQRCSWATLGRDKHFVAKALEVPVRLSPCWEGGGGEADGQKEGRRRKPGQEFPGEDLTFGLDIGQALGAQELQPRFPRPCDFA